MSRFACYRLCGKKQDGFLFSHSSQRDKTEKVSGGSLKTTPRIWIRSGVGKQLLRKKHRRKLTAEWGSNPHSHRKMVANCPTCSLRCDRGVLVLPGGLVLHSHSGLCMVGGRKSLPFRF